MCQWGAIFWWYVSLGEEGQSFGDLCNGGKGGILKGKFPLGCARPTCNQSLEAYFLI